ncbi:MAG: GNAT family N-acetyltransferase [Bacteroidota bacterium]|nr:GNAT family N-acetyltransferase [Bacteroidota bacterium]
MLPINKNEKNQVLSILSKSFERNKSVNYIIKKGQKKLDGIRGLMGYALFASIRHSGAYLSKCKNGAVLFTYPHQKKSLRISDIKETLKLVLNVFGIFGIITVLKRESYINKYHPKVDFLYLWFIGVTPEKQGKGIGGKLLSQVIQIAKGQKLPICMETSSLENLPFYINAGFSIYHEWLDPKAGFTLYFLKRDNQ